MGDKLRVGLNFSFDNSSNSGIVNYIYNIISALKTLDNDNIPEVVVFYTSNAPIDYLKSINYPHITFLPFQNFPSNYLLGKANAVFRRIFGWSFFKKIKYFNKIDCLYPYFEFLDKNLVEAPNKIHWLVDFNSIAFPGHYADNGNSMKEFQKKLVYSKEKIILSSNSLRNELNNYFPNYTCDVRVVPFASTLPALDFSRINKLLSDYKIEGTYFISPNQFWEHKNQVVVLKAMNLIRKLHPELVFNVVFTGSLEVHRGKGKYAEEIKNWIAEYKLDSQIRFLGIVERIDQLILMKGSVAILQPSLYEGWSTLVEEAKALDKYIILSDLPVHHEQIVQNCDFFDPGSYEELAEKMIHRLINPQSEMTQDYKKNVIEFGKSLMRAFR